MAFCVGCGSQLKDEARFCPNCGRPTAGGGAADTAPRPAALPLEYSIQGDNLQVARIQLKPGQQIFAEAGKMVYKTPSVYWETRMSGSTLGEKLLGALKRTVLGESIFLTYFHSDTSGEVGFAGNYPGKLAVFDLVAGQSILAQRDAFVLAEGSVQLNVALVKRLGAGFFGGEGFILERLTGPGKVFIHGGGDFVEFTLKPGEMLQVNTGCIVAFDESVGYDIEMVGGIKSALFGGEGLFLAAMTGPGRVWIQTLPFSRLADRIYAARGGDREDVKRDFGGAIGALGDLIGGDR